LFIRIKDNEIEETKQLMKELTNNNRNKSNVNYKFQKIIRVPIAVKIRTELFKILTQQ